MTEFPRTSKIEVVGVAGKEEGSKRALDFLHVDKNTLLLLSGGTTPDRFYQLLAETKKFKPGAVALVDERFGSPFHEQSNEKMIRDTGFFKAMENKKVPVERILKDSVNERERTAMLYEARLRQLFSIYRKRVAIMGIGEGGHIAGIAPNSSDFENPIFGEEYKGRLVGNFDDRGKFGERITLTPGALAEIDTFIILAFGLSKAEALKKFVHGPVEDTKTFPAMWLRWASLVPNVNVILITDQPV